MDKVKKKIGLGSISLLLCVMGILFSFSFGDKGCYGDAILKSIGIKSWSNGSSGIHYTIFYSSIFFIPSFIVGYKFKNNLGATLGKIISLIILIFIIIGIPALIA
ncbi:hypothetical protein [Desulfitobacterium sp.]|uniref:hypothetical protein n=1 Tax=Desulfitobacterium sp. TaxID=49981 RepID=UPI002B91A108|nr:hypothetical protein [Desulfitobacterium sp.]HVJ50208.1 hypothetical protein [Desulfitobacterium sp.]